uniref:Uncharacterized protein n=1 Tax=Cacopsylla melanoneura TaxID=428564 RepID=A0A8D8WYF6_9HEMI
MMSNWTLSSNVKTELNSLCEKLAQHSPTIINDDSKYDDHILSLKHFWEMYAKDAPSLAANINDNPSGSTETFTPKYHEPLLPGVWKQSFVLDLIDEDQEDRLSEDSCSDDIVDSSEPQLEQANQEDTFLAELSQMF